MKTIVAQVYVKKENKILMVQENKIGKKEYASWKVGGK